MDWNGHAYADKQLLDRSSMSRRQVLGAVRWNYHLDQPDYGRETRMVALALGFCASEVSRVPSGEVG